MNSSTHSTKNLSYQTVLILCLLAKAVALCLFILSKQMGLSPDEAQYWTWSQALDWGYYSKPPAIAWQIKATTLLFGNTEFGVRSGAFIIGFAIAYLLYKIGCKAGISKRGSCMSALGFAFSPLGFYLSFAATTDGGAILFSTMALLVVLSQKEKPPNYVLIGLLIGCGALFKWIAFLFWPILVVGLLFLPKMRSWKLMVGIALSLLALLPTLYWNIHHDWATFKHVQATVTTKRGGNFFEFLSAQIALFSPIFFLLLLSSFRYFRKVNPRLFFLSLFYLASLAYLGMALFKKMQPNWAAYLYPPAFILIGWVAADKLKKGTAWFLSGLYVSIFCMALALLIPTLQLIVPFSFALNPFRQTMGVRNLKTALIEAGYTPNIDFLFSPTYQTTSLLSFYGPEQKRAYFFNVGHARKNQFSYWPGMEREKGKTGYFVVIENRETHELSWYETHYKERLSSYFSHVSLKLAYPLFKVAHVPVKYALIFECDNYSGSLPPPFEKY